MTRTEVAELLRAFQRGEVTEEAMLGRLSMAPIVDLGFANVDTHRALRKGFPEVIFGAGKTADQIVEIARRLAACENRVLVTRVAPEQAARILPHFPNARYSELGRCLCIETGAAVQPHGLMAVVSAGTSDLPVAEEAVETGLIMGHAVDRVYDVGVAGLHRLFAKLDRILTADVVIVVAGMEGALPSVVAGLISKPIIAVPTSVGYGANFGGLSALLGMLNSCGSGVTVVNIDNGFGAAYAASQILRLIPPAPTSAGIDNGGKLRPLS